MRSKARDKNCESVVGGTIDFMQAQIHLGYDVLRCDESRHTACLARALPLLNIFDTVQSRQIRAGVGKHAIKLKNDIDSCGTATSRLWNRL
jgi:hypothetical protein